MANQHELLLQANGVTLCAETFGDPHDPAVLLVHGASASMLWWEEDLCERIAAGGRHVIRFDNRDTGRSVAYPPGRPGYALRDLADDAVAILDAFGIPRAHLVGRSMAGAIVALAAWSHPDRVASLTLVSTTPGDADLPGMEEAFLSYVSRPGPDPSDAGAVVDYIVGLIGAYAGGRYDEPATRALAERDVARTANVASCLTNHFLLDMSTPEAFTPHDLTCPTLVVHGDRDPVFPLLHAEAMRAALPSADLLVLQDTGHELPRRTWDTFVPALLAHTAGARQERDPGQA
ncbi:alpha/beta hydrolase [Dactylosporangium sp. AC04546]|uniref:alpha/beta fold hydrolase n=1 Tax=Dactylosporangium sp. AC04546 TaxID=2862460 RepID=UPI001EDCBC38|nr:alpha/beta hydrolase [Dactylosporangium sp. AC04546]WVK79783.1 alpha/beta hydrolase [Dactylosporangium sp. AC04546]